MRRKGCCRICFGVWRIFPVAAMVVASFCSTHIQPDTGLLRVPGGGSFGEFLCLCTSWKGKIHLPAPFLSRAETVSRVLSSDRLPSFQAIYHGVPAYCPPALWSAGLPFVRFLPFFLKISLNLLDCSSGRCRCRCAVLESSHVHRAIYHVCRK
ncbi:hypothetical protein VTN77DRAFT_5771 [Rasamsonia byssochlamydoides]|uniref:uncharacterized protein n=1 Tax=Rasamsonia byssochlamydoides TaxID=89139 RepID=UPI00374386B9